MRFFFFVWIPVISKIGNFTYKYFPPEKVAHQIQTRFKSELLAKEREEGKEKEKRRVGTPRKKVLFLNKTELDEDQNNKFPLKTRGKKNTHLKKSELVVISVSSSAVCGISESLKRREK